MNAAPSPLFATVPERIAGIIFALCQTVSMRLRTATVTQAQVTYIVARLLGMRQRFRRLAERIRAGKPPRERPRTPREMAPAPEFPAEFPLGFRPPPPGWRRWAVHADKPVPLWRSLRQTTFAWLLPFAPNVPEFRDSAVAHRALLLNVLAEPETQALLRASRRVGDSLRPLCWMLGIESSVLYPAPVSVVDAMGPAPARAADDRGPSPVTDERASSTIAPPVVATPGPIMPGVMEPPAEGDFFATA